MNTAEKRINRHQIKLIHTLKGALKLPEEDYRNRVMAVHGFSDTCKDLSEEEAAELIGEMEKEAIEKGVWKRHVVRDHGSTFGLKYEDLGKRKGFASPKQLRLIEALWKGVSRTHKADARQLALRRFIFRMTGVQELQWLTEDNAHGVIEAIKNMTANEKRRHQ